METLQFHNFWKISSSTNTCARFILHLRNSNNKANFDESNTMSEF